MKIVIDTNVLLSALIKDSTTRGILINSYLDFYYPEISFHEVRKYKKLVMEKSKLKERDYNILLDRIMSNVSLIPIESMKRCIKEADEMLGKIDVGDVVFLAAAMSLENAIIWSDDSHFNHQKRSKVVKTSDMVKQLYSRKL